MYSDREVVDRGWDMSEPIERGKRDDSLVPDPIPDSIGAPEGDIAQEEAGETRPLTRRQANARTEPIGGSGALRTRGAARLLAFAGALLFAVAAWLPWAVVTGVDATNPFAGSLRLPLDPGSIGAPPLPGFYHLGAAFVVWSTLSILGILLAALLWIGAGQLSAFITWLGYTTWLLLASYTSVRSAMALLDASGRSLRLAPGAGPESIAVAGSQLAIGIPLAALALLLAWIGGILVLVAGAKGLPRARVFTGGVGAPHPAGRWLLLAGLAGWAFGFLELPWVSADCASPLLAGGTCSGLRATQLLGPVLGGALGLPLAGGSNGFAAGVDPRAALYAIPTALLGAAVLLAVAFWRRAAVGTVYTWAALWLLAASGFAILARIGAQQAVAGGVSGLPAGAWQAATGIYVTLGSLVLVLLGLALHWLAPHFLRNHQMQPA